MDILSDETFKKIHRLHIITQHLAQDLLVGMYKSAFKGRGIEFEEVREYVPGDDIRSIDWNVTARMQHPYIKNFREEREISVMLMVDISASSRFGTNQQLKNELMAELGALIAFSAIKSQDKVGLILFSERIEKYLLPKKGTRHVLRVIRELLVPRPAYTGSDLAGALTFLGKVQKRSCVTFLISDFLCPDFSKEFQLLARKHDLIAVRVYDRAEEKFPQIPLLNMQDLETGVQSLLDTTQAGLQKHFQQAVQTRKQAYEKMVAASGSSWLEIATGESPLKALQGFFKRREKKR